MNAGDFGRYCLLCIDEGDVVCVDYTDDLALATAWETPVVSNIQFRWYEDTKLDPSEAN